MKFGPPSPGAFVGPLLNTDAAGMPANTNAVMKAANDPRLRGNPAMHLIEKMMPLTNAIIASPNPYLLRVRGNDKSGSPGALIAICRIMGCVME
jgi:hypothetical protein